MAWDDVLADLENTDDEKLGTTRDEMISRAHELRQKKGKEGSLSPEEIEELTGLTEAFKQVDGTVTQRAEQRQAADQAADEALSAIPDPSAKADAPEEGAETEGGEQAEKPDAEKKPATKATPPAPGTQESGSETQPVAAGAQVPALGKTGQQQAKKATAPKVAIGITAGGRKIEWDGVGDAMANALNGLRNNEVYDGVQASVVTLRASGVPDERVLKRQDHPDRNTAKIEAVTNPTALVAAGGLCAPLAIDYSYDVIGVQGRPIRDSMAGFQAERGGIQYRPAISPVTDTSANGPKKATDHWTMADDVAAADPGGTGYKRKAVWIVDCPTTTTAQVEAITLQMEFSNVTSRFDPETLQANQQAALIWHDRHCENWLWSQMAAKSKTLTSQQVLGATRDALVTLDRAQAYLRSKHRISANLPLKTYMPFWAVHLFRADIARAMSFTPTESLAITDEQITSLLRTRGVDVTWHLDGADTQVAAVTGPPAVPAIPAQQYANAAANSPVPDFPVVMDILMHPQGHFQHLDGGTLDLGIVRDSDLIERNRYRQFSETWEGVAARGVEALRLVASLRPTGESAGTIDVTTSN